MALRAFNRERKQNTIELKPFPALDSCGAPGIDEMHRGKRLGGGEIGDYRAKTSDNCAPATPALRATK